MDAEKWKAALNRFLAKDKTVKLLLILGLCGVALIFLSTLLGDRKKEEQVPAGETAKLTAEEYGRKLEEDLARIVRAVTEEETPTVLVTLESGSRYVYAVDEKAGSQREGEKKEEENETIHVILKDADGAQRALAVTEIQPEIKGVVIVSRYAGDPAIREKLTDAVKTALNLSSARVCVTDTG